MTALGRDGRGAGSAVTITIREKRRRRQRQRALAYLGVTAAWALSIWVSQLLSPPDWMHVIALFGHLAALVVGLGAVLAIDWHALLWATGWSSVRELRQADRTLIIPIWVGLFGLLATGALLEPHLDSPLTIVKMVAVLVLSLNGVALTRWTADLARVPPTARYAQLPKAARVGFMTSAIVSQVAWWTAVFIGMLNATT